MNCQSSFAGRDLRIFQLYQHFFLIWKKSKQEIENGDWNILVRISFMYGCWNMQFECIIFVVVVVFFSNFLVSRTRKGLLYSVFSLVSIWTWFRASIRPVKHWLRASIWLGVVPLKYGYLDELEIRSTVDPFQKRNTPRKKPSKSISFL